MGMDIESFLGAASRLRVLVVGDLMLDEYLWGGTERISPEAPVPIVDLRREELRLGGAGNVINNLCALGCRVHVATVVGEDEDGHRLLQLLKDKDVDVSGVFFASGRKTTRKTRVLADHQQVLRIDRETRTSISLEQQGLLLNYFRDASRTFDLILVADYLKGVVGSALVQELVALGKRLDIPVVVDPKGSDYHKYKGVTAITPNRRELQIAVGQDLSREQDLIIAAHRFREDLALEALVLTRSEEGMSVFGKDGQLDHLKADAREVFDVSGAGDTVLAFLGMGLGSGCDIKAAAELANVAAGIVVGKLGTSVVTPKELRLAVCDQPGSQGKIRSCENLVGILKDHRRHGKTVVFTNGCFDLLHVGHVQYLQKARTLGDVLVLGLNSDQSVRRLKGGSRPLIGQEERAHILAALDCISYVTIFEEDTPLSLIEAVRPDVLVKGGDYSPEAVVGKDFVESYGGRLELVSFVEGKSTTGILERILENSKNA